MKKYIDEAVLNQKAKFYAREIWNWNFSYPVIINCRYKTTLGQSLLGEKILLASFILDNEYITDDVLLHELCHCYCHDVLNVEWTDFSTPFLQEISKTGASLTGSIGKRNGHYFYLNKEYVPKKELIELQRKFYESEYYGGGSF